VVRTEKLAGACGKCGVSESAGVRLNRSAVGARSGIACRRIPERFEFPAGIRLTARSRADSARADSAMCDDPRNTSSQDGVRVLQGAIGHSRHPAGARIVGAGIMLSCGHFCCHEYDVTAVSARTTEIGTLAGIGIHPLATGQRSLRVFSASVRGRDHGVMLALPGNGLSTKFNGGAVSAPTLAFHFHSPTASRCKGSCLRLVLRLGAGWGGAAGHARECRQGFAKELRHGPRSHAHESRTGRCALRAHRERHAGKRSRLVSMAILMVLTTVLWGAGTSCMPKTLGRSPTVHYADGSGEDGPPCPASVTGSGISSPDTIHHYRQTKNPGQIVEDHRGGQHIKAGDVLARIDDRDL